MIVNGHEIKFMRTVLANCEIAKVCENRDISNFDKLLSNGSTLDSYKAQMTFICALQKGYEMHEKFADPEYVPYYLTEDELMLMDPEALSQLFVEAANAYKGDAEVEVETQEKKAKKNNEEPDSE